MPIEVELVAAIERSLNTEMVDNAVFLGEQLYYCAPTDRNAELLARCYLRQNRPSVSESQNNSRISFIYFLIVFFFQSVSKVFCVTLRQTLRDFCLPLRCLICMHMSMLNWHCVAHQ